jgi:hypothetical protein
MLLRSYSIEYQIDFGDEMLNVFRQAAARQRAQGFAAYLRFLWREYTGLLLGAFRERQFRSRLAPVLGGLVVAALVNYLFYSGMFQLMRATGGALRHASLPITDPLAAPITIVLFVLAALLPLLPLFILLGSRVNLRRP